MDEEGKGGGMGMVWVWDWLEMFAKILVGNIGEKNNFLENQALYWWRIFKWNSYGIF